jgi:hypothetical protein
MSPSIVARVVVIFLFLLSGAEGNFVARGQRTSVQFKRQYRDTVWTLSGDKVLDDRYRKWRVDLSADARITMISNTRTRLGGVRLGLEYRRVHRFGIGIYNVGDGVGVSTLREISPAIDTATLTMGYISAYYERVLLFNRKWEWSVTGHIGRGSVQGDYLFLGSSKVETFDQRFTLVEASSVLYYHLTYFMSVGAGLGYRGVDTDISEISRIYSSPVAVLRLRIRLFKMVGGLFSKDIRERH